MSLEIVPEQNSTALRSGDDFSIKVLKGGAPFGDFSIGMMCQGSALASFQKTDAETNYFPACSLRQMSVYRN